jgi:competence protein ComEA
MTKTRLLLGLLAMLTVFGSAGIAHSAEPAGLDINTASITDLMTLPGLGRKRAEEIIRRRLVQPFRRTSDLLRIKGIGRRTYLKLKPFVRVTPDVTAQAPVEAK